MPTRPRSKRRRDVDDDYVVALAREHSVEFIVTGDKAVLELEDQTPPVITPPAAFEELFGGLRRGVALLMLC